jgi:hypothetical protein
MGALNDIVMKLVLQGVNPAEAQRVAASSVAQLERELAASLARQVEAHRKAAEATTNEAKKAAAAEVKEATNKSKQLIGVMKTVEREMKRAANASTNAWRRTLEDLENISTIMMGMKSLWGTAAGGISTIKRMGDEISRVTQINGSLQGSIDALRRATGGEVADLDLILSKNRAVAKELRLTDQQFAIAAATAQQFGDALGGTTRENLDKLVDALAEGKAEMLKQIGVMVDQKEVYKQYADSIGVAVDKLTDQEKRTALLEAALRKMDEKLVQSGGVVRDFGNDWEKTVAQVTNVWNESLLAIGKMVQTYIGFWTVDIPNAIKIGIAQLKDVATLGTQNYEAQARAAYGAALEGSTGNAAAAAKRLAEGTAYSYDKQKRGPGIVSHVPRSFEYGSDGAAAKPRIDYVSPDSPQVLGMDYYIKQAGFAQAKRDAETLAETRASQGRAYGDFVGSQRENQAMSDAAEAADKLLNDSRLQDLRGLAGNGILSNLIFGSDEGREKFMTDVEFAKQQTAEMAGFITAAGEQMSVALASELTAALAGEKSFSEAIRNATKNTLKMIGQESIVRALFEAAKGVAALAVGNPQAAGHFAAAAKFGAVGVAAGLAAGAIGGGGASAGTSSVPTSRSASDFSSAAPRGERPRDTGGPLTLNIYVAPGGEAEAGRSIIRALEGYKAQTGRGVDHLLVGA